MLENLQTGVVPALSLLKMVACESKPGVKSAVINTHLAPHANIRACSDALLSDCSGPPSLVCGGCSTLRSGYKATWCCAVLGNRCASAVFIIKSSSIKAWLSKKTAFFFNPNHFLSSQSVSLTICIFQLGKNKHKSTVIN